MLKLRYSASSKHTAPTTTVKISPNRLLFATSSSDRHINVHDLRTGKLITSLQGHSKGVSDISWSSDSQYLCSGSDDFTIRVWNVEFGECIRVLKGHTFHITSVRFNHKGNLIVSGSADEAIRIWDVAQGRCLKTLSAHSDPIASLDLVWDDTIIASASYDGLIRLFDTDSGQCLKTLIYDKFTTSSSFPVSCVKFTPNGKYLLATTLDNTVRLWDYMDNKVVKTYSGGTFEKFTCDLGFIGGGFIVSGDEKGDLLIWDLQSKKVVERVPSESGDGDERVLQVDVLGNILVAVNFKGVVKLYDIQEI